MMLKTTYLLKKIALILALFLGTIGYAQVGIGTTTPANGSLLDLDATDKGFLVPRVNIANLGTIAPVTPSGTTGLLVWNTNAGTGIGFHYWNGSAWVPLSIAATNDWSITGNANIANATNFLGTTNNRDINIRTTNLERMRVQGNGQVSVGFGAGAANTGDQLSAVGVAANGVGVAGYSGGNGSGVYGQNIGGGNAVWGINNSSGNAIFGYSLGVGASGDAVHAEHDGSGDAVNAVNYGTGAGVYGENFFFTDYSIYGVDGLASVYGDNTAFGYDGVVGLSDDTVSNGVWGINENTNGTAIIGGSNGLNIYNTGGGGIAGSGTSNGVFGYAGAGTTVNANRGNSAGQFTLDTDSNPATTTGNNGTRASASLAGFDNLTPDGSMANRNSYYGGYFSGGNVNGTPSFAYAGIKYNTNVNGTTGTDFKIIGNGTNSTIITDRTNTPRILFSPEAPEILFEDYGTAKLVNGVAEIIIDPILKDAIYVDEAHPLKVFIQLEGDCNGVYVTNKSSNGFTVKELANGTSTVSFSWHLVANRADTKNANGEVTSTHVGLRFPEGPGPLKEKELGSRKRGDTAARKMDVSSKKRKTKVVPSTEAKNSELTQEEIDKLTKKVEVSGQ